MAYYVLLFTDPLGLEVPPNPTHWCMQYPCQTAAPPSARYWGQASTVSCVRDSGGGGGASTVMGTPEQWQNQSLQHRHILNLFTTVVLGTDEALNTVDSKRNPGYLVMGPGRLFMFEGPGWVGKGRLYYGNVLRCAGSAFPILTVLRPRN